MAALSREPRGMATMSMPCTSLPKMQRIGKTKAFSRNRPNTHRGKPLRNGLVNWRRQKPPASAEHVVKWDIGPRTLSVPNIRVKMPRRRKCCSMMMTTRPETAGDCKLPLSDSLAAQASQTSCHCPQALGILDSGACLFSRPGRPSCWSWGLSVIQCPARIPLKCFNLATMANRRHFS